MNFTRIKVTDKIVELDWSELLPNGEKKSISLESPNRPLPALLQAMAAFRDYVVELLELPTTWLDDLRITTINIDEGKDGRRWLDGVETIGTDDPPAITRDATPSMFDEMANDGWTQETPPPKASEIGPL